MISKEGGPFGLKFWQETFGRYFQELPEPDQREAPFRDCEITDFEPGDSDIGGVIYYDQVNGKELREFVVTDDWYGGPSVIFRDIREFEYKPICYRHPISGEEFGAEVVEIRTWDTDEKWQKTAKQELQRAVIIFDKDWSPDSGAPREPRVVLEESMYEPMVSESPVGQSSLWLEYLRSVFYGRSMFLYQRDGEVTLQLVYKPIPDPKFAEENINFGSIPRNLGKAQFMTF